VIFSLNMTGKVIELCLVYCDYISPNGDEMGFKMDA
jgi:hypothetical protein